MQTERRFQRSPITDHALSLYFQEMTKNSECSTIALSDDVGLIISGSGPGQEALAANAAGKREGINSAPMQIGGIDFVLSWVGKTPSLDDTRAAVARILVLS